MFGLQVNDEVGWHGETAGSWDARTCMVLLLVVVLLRAKWR